MKKKIEVEVANEEAISKILKRLNDIEFEIEFIFNSLNYLSGRIGRIEDRLGIDEYEETKEKT